MSGLCRVGIALTMKGAYGRIITQKYLLGVDVEALPIVVLEDSWPVLEVPNKRFVAAAVPTMAATTVAATSTVSLG